jgi:hypothetical protein
MGLIKNSFFLFLVIPVFAAKDVNYVTLGPISPVILKGGKTVEVVVPLQVVPNFHVQANPATTPQLVPTSLEMKGEEGIKVLKIEYPPGKPYQLQGAKMPISTYNGAFEIKVTLLAVGKKKLRKYELKGVLNYQACNDKICFFPSHTPVLIPLRVE